MRIATAAEATALGLDPIKLGFALTSAASPPPTKAKPKRTPKPLPTRRRLAEGSSVLGLDVSSKAVGVALMTATTRGPRLDAARLFTAPAAWGPLARIDKLSNDVAAYVSRLGRVDLAILEWADGVRWMSKERGPNWSRYLVSLVAAQATVRVKIQPYAAELEYVASSEWTGRVKKEKRADLLRLKYWQLRTLADPGLDVLDAAGIAEWRITR